MRPIDGDEAIRLITAQKGVVDKSSCKRILCQMPTVEVKVKHGTWKRIADEVFADRFECSECGTLPPMEDLDWWLSDYCPNCGAKMDGKEEDDGRSI